MAVNSDTGKDCVFDLRLGELSSTQTLSATVGSAGMCPLGWTSGPSANTGGNTVALNAGCSGASFELKFFPVPASGGSAPCTSFYMNVNQVGGFSCSGGQASGTTAVSGVPGSFRITGSCSCTSGSQSGSVTFSSLPLSVQ